MFQTCPPTGAPKCKVAFLSSSTGACQNCKCSNGTGCYEINGRMKCMDPCAGVICPCKNSFCYPVRLGICSSNANGQTCPGCCIYAGLCTDNPCDSQCCAPGKKCVVLPIILPPGTRPNPYCVDNNITISTPIPTK